MKQLPRRLAQILVSLILLFGVAQTWSVEEDVLRAVLILLNNGAVDEDGDGFLDLDDAFPEDPTEWLDTDSDGVGNNADLDDDDDGVPDASDQYPLISLNGALDSDQDGIPNNCDAACRSAGMAADTDDDNDGIADAQDYYPLIPIGDRLDTDRDGIPNDCDSACLQAGMQADTDDDGDEVADISDLYPLDPYEWADTDGDGVGDNADVFPNDANISRGIRFQLSNRVASVAVGEKVREGRSASRRSRSALAESESDFEADSNLQAYDAENNLVEDAVLSNVEVFFAETNVSPDGQYGYFLTAPHIQHAFGLPEEVCNIYRVELATNLAQCLLPSGNLFINPKSLANQHRLDMGRTGMVFRSDGAALMHGFDSSRELGGLSLFMSPDGEVTVIEPGPGEETIDAVWLTDNLIALIEKPPPDNGVDSYTLRMVSPDTLDTVGQPLVFDDDDYPYYIAKWKGGLYLPEYRYDVGTATLSPRSPPSGSGFEEAVLVTPDGLEAFSIYTQGGVSFALSLVDGEVIRLGDPWVGGGGNYVPINLDRSGTGTGISYPPFDFTEEFMIYESVRYPENELVNVAGTAIAVGERYSIPLVAANANLLIDGQDWWGIELLGPPETDIVVDYSYKPYGDDSSVTPSTTQLVVSFEALSAWYSDLENSDVPYCHAHEQKQCFNIPTQVPNRETVCVHKRGSTDDLDRCIDFSAAAGVEWDLDVLNHDIESYRYKRYDGEEVYPDGSGNAFPGVQTVLLVNGRLQAYVKDSADHRYYSIVGDVASFYAQGQSALSIAPASNGGGDAIIMLQASTLSGFSATPYDGLSVGSGTVSGGNGTAQITFQQPLSDLFGTPNVVLSRNGVSVQGVTASVGAGNAQTLSLSFAETEPASDVQYVLSFPSGFYLSGSALVYQPSTPVTFSYQPLYPDEDGDGFGNEFGEVAWSLGTLAGYVDVVGDCDDQDATRNPGADELYDQIDNDCDAEVDEGFVSWYQDQDGDGYGVESEEVFAINQPDGYVDVIGDCNDSDAAINPGAAEVYDQRDNDCDGEIDEGFTAWYADLDGDGYGDPLDEIFAVEQPDGYVSVAGDCDDSEATTNPGAAELYDQVDNDCDDEIDEDFTAWYADQDGDGYGDPSGEIFAVDQPDGYVSNSVDCDDSDSSINPGAEEVIGDGIDNDCDGFTE